MGNTDEKGYSPQVVSIFSGCGGLDLGFHLEGYETIWANDFAEWAVKSFEKNFAFETLIHQRAEKTIAEITVADVLRMVRQKEFTNLAMSKAISFLQEDVFAGESYEGELLEKVSEMDSSFLISYADDLKNIINNALVKSETRDWTYDGEEEEFKDMIDALSTKVM